MIYEEHNWGISKFYPTDKHIQLSFFLPLINVVSIPLKPPRVPPVKSLKLCFSPPTLHTPLVHKTFRREIEVKESEPVGVAKMRIPAANNYVAKTNLFL